MPFRAPASGWQRKNRGLVGGNLLFPLLGIAAVLVLLFIGSIVISYFPDKTAIVLILEISLLFAAIYLFYLTQSRINTGLLDPLSHLRHWAIRMRNGNLSAQIPVPRHGEFAILAKDINQLGESLRALSREMDDEVNKQTERLAQKTRYLEILYEVSTTSNTTSDINDLLVRYLGTMKSIMEAKAATIRMLTNDNQLRLVGSLGFENNLQKEEQIVPIERCLCAQNFSANIIRCTTPSNHCQNLLPITRKGETASTVVALPLQYQKKTLGIFHLFMDETASVGTQDQDDILINIAQHLSLAVEKDRLEDESTRMSIMQERTMLAHELHDSLAQTLASLRFQVSTLTKTMAPSNDQLAKNEVSEIKVGLDEANNELRELLAHFRVPMDERGLVYATQALIERFKNQTGIAVFFQNECPDLKLPSVVEVQVLHIIQESLANIRKHSKAENVRIMLRNTREDRYHLLVEDDGIGIESDYSNAKPGEHVGLSIMQERARRIDGELHIETELGEGTRVELDFYYTRNFDKEPDQLADRVNESIN